MRFERRAKTFARRFLIINYQQCRSHVPVGRQWQLPWCRIEQRMGIKQPANSAVQTRTGQITDAFMGLMTLSSRGERPGRQVLRDVLALRRRLTGREARQVKTVLDQIPNARVQRILASVAQQRVQHVQKRSFFIRHVRN